jgi:hypothetical protein
VPPPQQSSVGIERGRFPAYRPYYRAYLLQKGSCLVRLAAKLAELGPNSTKHGRPINADPSVVIVVVFYLSAGQREPPHANSIKIHTKGKHNVRTLTSASSQDLFSALCFHPSGRDAIRSVCRVQFPVCRMLSSVMVPHTRRCESTPSGRGIPPTSVHLRARSVVERLIRGWPLNYTPRLRRRSRADG